MAYVSPGQQYEQKEFTVGLAKSTQASAVWHVPEDVSANIMEFVEAINVPIVGPTRIADPGIGRVFPAYNPSLGKIEVSGDMMFSAATYGQIDWLFAACFGDDVVTNPGGSAYLHTLTVADNVWDVMFTLAYLMQGNVATEAPSLKFHSFELTANPGEVAKVKFECIADYVIPGYLDDARAGTVGSADDFTLGAGTPWTADQWIGLYAICTASSVASEVGTAYPITDNDTNSLTATGLTAGVTGTGISIAIGGLNSGLSTGGTFYSTSSEDFGDRLHFDDLVVRIGDSGTSPLASDGSTCFNVGAIKINFERPMQGDFRSGCAADNVMEKHSVWQPRDTDICKLTAEITFPNYDAQSAALLKYWISTAPQSRRLEFIFTSTLEADTGYPYYFKLYIPACFISGAPINIPLNGGVPVTLTFEATLYSDGSTGPSILIQNANSDDLVTAGV